jgi:hypothetical protein
MSRRVQHWQICRQAGRFLSTIAEDAMAYSKEKELRSIYPTTCKNSNRKLSSRREIKEYHPMTLFSPYLRSS